MERALPHRRYGLLWTLVITSVLADQLSKAWFVYKLGSHPPQSFLEFLPGYFQLWAGFNGPPAVIANYFPFATPIQVYGHWVQWTLTTNTGAAWSLFAGNSFVLSFVSLIMAVVLYVFWRRSFSRHLGMTWALGAIIGGALGNFLDRFRLHEVVDFIDTKIPLIGKLIPQLGDPYDFPIFNIADSCAVCGTIAFALYLIIADLRRMRRHPAPREFTPLTEGLRLDEAARERLHELAAAQPARTSLGLTVHIGPREEGSAATSDAVAPPAAPEE
jgi:signal peptidase II